MGLVYWSQDPILMSGVSCEVTKVTNHVPVLMHPPSLQNWPSTSTDVAILSSLLWSIQLGFSSTHNSVGVDIWMSGLNIRTMSIKLLPQLADWSKQSPFILSCSWLHSDVVLFLTTCRWPVPNTMQKVTCWHVTSSCTGRTSSVIRVPYLVSLCQTPVCLCGLPEVPKSSWYTNKSGEIIQIWSVHVAASPDVIQHWDTFVPNNSRSRGPGRWLGVDLARTISGQFLFLFIFASNEKLIRHLVSDAAIQHVRSHWVTRVSQQHLVNSTTTQRLAWTKA